MAQYIGNIYMHKIPFLNVHSMAMIFDRNGFAMFISLEFEGSLLNVVVAFMRNWDKPLLSIKVASLLLSAILISYICFSNKRG
jgi:hypothetical protein